jgi:Polyketide cyclase / dehydrase and lipid transport
VTAEPQAAHISASGLVPAGREAVFAFLSRLDNHWRVADRWIDVVSLDGGSTGGRVRVRGPLGLRRTARTRVLVARPPECMEGSADLGRTRGRVRWTLRDAPGGTLVRLEAWVERAGPADRLLLALGGRAWLRRRFAATVRGLATSWPPGAPPAPA